MVRQQVTMAMLAAAMAVAASGCASIRRAHAPRIDAAPPMPLAPEVLPRSAAPTATAGSLWAPETAVAWFADDKATRPGDTILVRVVQRTTGSKKANTGTQRKSSITASIKAWLGLEDAVRNLGAYDSSDQNLIEAQSERSFSGQGSVERSDTLQATVSAVVTDVLSNGNLVIYGHQTVTINNEASVLTVQGIVRPTDIAADNSIDSTRIANARIEFTGAGVLDDTQHPGWAVGLFDWVWPF